MSILVGKSAPDFAAAAVLGNGEIVGKFSLAEEIKGKYALVFFYPLNFTFVCPSELIALDHRIEKFEKMGIKVVGVSIDSQFTHNAYRNTPIDKGGIGPVRYPLIADVSHKICQAYGIEHPEASVAFRAAFLIDKKGIVRAQIINDLPIGRDIDEIIRLFSAIQFSDEHGEVCPAGWKAGNKAMKPTPAGVASYLADNASDL